MEKVLFNFFSQSNVNRLLARHNKIMLEARDNQARGDLKGFALKIFEADEIARVINTAKISIHDN